MRRLLKATMESLRRAIVCLATLAMSWAPATLAAARPSADAFLDAHRVAVGLNRPDVDFQIRFKDGRTAFNPREPIVLELTFDTQLGLVDFMPLDPCRDWALADVMIDLLEGLGTPQRTLCGDLTGRIPMGVLSGRPGGALAGVGGSPPPRLAPRVLTLTVNDWYRFDRPGTFRLYVRSAHTTGDGSDEPPQTSNVLTFTIGARDTGYEQGRVASAADILAASTSTLGARRQALEELRRLATDAAAPALARFYPSNRDEAHEADIAMAGLLMVPNRAVAVSALEAELRRPARPLTPGFVRDLASLEVTRRGTLRPEAEAEYLTLVAHYADERARALDITPGRLEAAFRDDLREGGAHEGQFYRGVLGPVAVRHPREATAAFARLQSREQRNLLIDSWRRFAHPAFVPLVRRLALSPTGRDDALRDIALRRWLELAPAQARPVLRQERARRLPRVSMETLARLGGAVGPHREAVWEGLLATETDLAVLISAADRLARFGKGRYTGAVSRTWHRRRRELPVEASGAALAYLLNADQRLGLDALQVALDGPPEERGAGVPGEGLLWHAMSRRWTPVFEGRLYRAFAHPDRDVWMDAVHLAREFGSPGTKTALELALAYFLRNSAAVDTGPPRGADAQNRVDRIEALASVLGAARGWTLSDAENERWAAQCPTTACRTAFEHRLPHSDPDRVIWVKGPTPGDEARLEFCVDGVCMAEEWMLLSKLRDYPFGTRFAWLESDSWGRENERWTAVERLAKFQEIAYYAKHGGVIVTTSLRYVR
jgi:hypothetical protein